MRALTGLGIGYALVALALLAVGLVWPVDDGALGMVAILAPYFALLIIVVIPIAAVVRSRALALVVVAVAALFVLRLGGEWWSFPPSPIGDGIPTIDVATWNVEAGAATPSAIVAMLDSHPVDIVVLEELTLPVAAAIEADAAIAARYPHRALFPRAGVGVLSALPISAATSGVAPSRVEATIDVDRRQVTLLGAHAFSTGITRVRGIPVGLEPGPRNADLALVRQRVLELNARGEDVLVMGDFNTAPTEPAFARLTSGLHDAHAEVGIGPGWTWRPSQLEFLGIGLLRIDLILSTAKLVPQRTSIACPARGDHCLFQASIALVP
jgi:vancomycin resistance protein VanJ